MVTTALALLLIGAIPHDVASDEPNRPHQSLIGRVILVPDGDTVVLKVGDTTERVQLLGTTTAQTAHAEAAAWLRTTHLEALAKGQIVTVDAGLNPARRDGALVAQVRRVSDGLWVNLEMIKEGYSWSSGTVSDPFHARFHAAEVEARAHVKGLWSADELADAAVDFDQIAAAKHAQTKNQLERALAIRRLKQIRMVRARHPFAMPAQAFMPAQVFMPTQGFAASRSTGTTYRDDDRRRSEEDNARRRSEENDDRRRTALNNEQQQEQAQRYREQQQQREAEVERRQYVAQMQEIARERALEQQRAYVMQQYQAQERQAYYGVQERSSGGGGGGGGQEREPAHHAEAPAHHEEHHDPHHKK